MAVGSNTSLSARDIGQLSLRDLRGLPTAIAFLVLSTVGYLVVRHLTHPSSIDLLVYRIEGGAIRSGLDLYGPLSTPQDLSATYPPFAALVFVLLTLVPLALLPLAMVALNIALLVTVAYLSFGLAGLGKGEARITCALWLAGLAVWSEPVFTTLRYGQINLLILAMILWDFSRPDSARTRGMALGFAVGLKITPGIFILYLVLTRRFRMAAVAIAAFVTSVIAGALVVPGDSKRYWTSLIFDSDRVGRPENAANQSVRAIVVRLEHTRDIAPAWTLLLVLTLLAGLICSVLAYQAIGDSWGVPACAVTGLLASPVTWTHHWVWCVPLMALLYVQTRRWLWTTIIFWSFAVWAVPHTYPAELHFSLVQSALSVWYVLFGLGFLALTAWQVYVTRSRNTAGFPAPMESPVR